MTDETRRFMLLLICFQTAGLFLTVFALMKASTYQELYEKQHQPTRQRFYADEKGLYTT